MNAKHPGTGVSSPGREGLRTGPDLAGDGFPAGASVLGSHPEALAVAEALAAEEPGYWQFLETLGSRIAP